MSLIDIITSSPPWSNYKILSLQDPKVISNFGLDQRVASKRGISRREKEACEVFEEANEFFCMNAELCNKIGKRRKYKHNKT